MLLTREVWIRISNGVNTFDHMLAIMLATLSVMLAFGKAPKQQDQNARWTFYKQGSFTGLAFAGACLFAWFAGGRPLGQYGIGSWLGDRPMQTALFASAWTVTIAVVLWSVSSGLGRERLRGIYASLAWLMPTTRKELAASWGVGVSAAIGEEVAYRGFLLWYLSVLLGLPAAVVLTTIAFGLSHGYQRLFGCIFATLAGLVLACAYIVSESLLLVICMHGTYNIASFTAGRFVLRGWSEDRRRLRASGA